MSNFEFSGGHGEMPEGELPEHEAGNEAGHIEASPRRDNVSPLREHTVHSRRNFLPLLALVAGLSTAAYAGDAEAKRAKRVHHTRTKRPHAKSPRVSGHAAPPHAEKSGSRPATGLSAAFSSDTPENRKTILAYPSVDALIAGGVITKHDAHGYLYYGFTDTDLWKKKTALIGRRLAKAEKKLGKIKDTKSKAYKKQRARRDAAQRYLNASTGARDHVLASPDIDYKTSSYRARLEAAVKHWVSIFSDEKSFAPYAEVLRDPDLYHALVVQEIIPPRLPVHGKRVALSEFARFRLLDLLTQYRDPLKMPAINDAVASFGIGQTTLDTNDVLRRTALGKKAQLPPFDECVSFECQVARDMVNSARNWALFDRAVLARNEHLLRLFRGASHEERVRFASAILGAQHNGGPGVVLRVARGIDKKIHGIKSLEAAGNVIVDMIRKSARRYGRHVEEIVETFDDLQDKGSFGKITGSTRKDIQRATREQNGKQTPPGKKKHRKHSKHHKR